MDTPWTAARAAQSGKPAPEAARRIAAPYPRRDASPPHEIASQNILAQRLAALLGLEWVADYDPAVRASVGSVYYVPATTLIGPQQAAALGVTGPRDLYGGVAPYGFVATKAITHPLYGRARGPKGWSTAFGARVRDTVLRGHTVFSLADARRAGAALLLGGPVRVKPARATAGRGQSLVSHRDELELALEALDASDLAQCGLVLEEHLEDVRTYSVGCAKVGETELAYVGTQELTRDNAGEMVYGGSQLLCVPGGFDALLAADIDPAEHRAVQLARAYDAAALACFPGLYASRRNYDVALGRSAAGAMRMGVLEQSWRFGGASIAEVCALEAFQADPGLSAVRAYTRERYGEHQPTDPSALVYHGHDTEVGLISKYGGISAYGNP